MQALLDLDYQIILFVCENMRSAVLNILMQAVTHLGDGGILWVVLALLCVSKKETRHIGITMIISLIVGLVIGNLMLKNIFARLRPFQSHEDIVNLIEQGGYSFPSGHSLSSFAAAVSFYLSSYGAKKLLLSEGKNAELMIFFTKIGKGLIILAAVIAFSRVYLGVHYPSDIICGSLIGILIAFLVNKLYSRYLNAHNGR